MKLWLVFLIQQRLSFLEELQRKPENNVLKFYNYLVNDGDQNKPLSIISIFNSV
jgi:hypothetical protein